MIHKIAGLFVNILTVDAKHYLHKRDDLTERIQMQLSKKQKTFSRFFFDFKSYFFNFKHLPNKDDIHSRCISRNTGSEKYG